MQILSQEIQSHEDHFDFFSSCRKNRNLHTYFERYIPPPLCASSEKTTHSISKNTQKCSFTHESTMRAALTSQTSHFDILLIYTTHTYYRTLKHRDAKYT